MNATLKALYYKYSKETRQVKGLAAQAHYGFDNYKWSGAISGFNLFNPKHGQRIAFSIGRYIEQFNAHQPISPIFNTAYTLFDKSNYMKLYQKDMIEIKYRQELMNGLYGNIEASYQSREALLNHSYYYFAGGKHKHFTSNNPTTNDGAYSQTPSFEPDQVLQFKVGFKFIPFAKYETYPTFKRLLATKWPEISAVYKKGISTNSSLFNYDYLEVGIGKDINLRAIGEFKFDILAGAFFNNANMNFIDYKHFNGNQTLFLTNPPNTEIAGVTTRTPISEFHALNYYQYSTNTKYIEYHVAHNFRGFFIGKIPLLRKTKFYEVAGINGLLTETGSYNEVYVGFDKILQILRFDVGTAINGNAKVNLFYRIGLRLSF